MDEANDHPVLKVMPEMTDVQKKFAAMSVAFLSYEEEIKSIWMKHNVKRAIRRCCYWLSVTYLGTRF